LLRADAPPEAIICVPWVIDNRYAEMEVIVDRRRLTGVRKIEQFGQSFHENSNGGDAR
jgi:hypothetical protein